MTVSLVAPPIGGPPIVLPMPVLPEAPAVPPELPGPGADMPLLRPGGAAFEAPMPLPAVQPVPGGDGKKSDGKGEPEE